MGALAHHYLDHITLPPSYHTTSIIPLLSLSYNSYPISILHHSYPISSCCATYHISWRCTTLILSLGVAPLLSLGIASTLGIRHLLALCHSYAHCALLLLYTLGIIPVSRYSCHHNWH